MLMKIGGLARALAIILAIVAGFVALTMMNVPLVLIVLGLVAGLALPEERQVAAMLVVVVLPIVGTVLDSNSDNWCAAQCGRAQSSNRNGRRRCHGDRHSLLSFGDGRRDGLGRRWKHRCASRSHALVHSIRLSGSVAHCGGAFFATALGERRLHQAAGAGGFDRGAKALLHQRHDRPMSFIDEAPVSATIAPICCSASMSLSCCGRKRSITRISPSSASARSSRPFFR